MSTRKQVEKSECDSSSPKKTWFFTKTRRRVRLIVAAMAVLALSVLFGVGIVAPAASGAQVELCTQHITVSGTDGVGIENVTRSLRIAGQAIPFITGPGGSFSVSVTFDTDPSSTTEPWTVGPGNVDDSRVLNSGDATFPACGDSEPPDTTTQEPPDTTDDPGSTTEEPPDTTEEPPSTTDDPSTEPTVPECDDGWQWDGNKCVPCKTKTTVPTEVTTPTEETTPTSQTTPTTPTETTPSSSTSESTTPTEQTTPTSQTSETSASTTSSASPSTVTQTTTSTAVVTGPQGPQGPQGEPGVPGPVVVVVTPAPDNAPVAAPAPVVYDSSGYPVQSPTSGYTPWWETPAGIAAIAASILVAAGVVAFSRRQQVRASAPQHR